MSIILDLKRTNLVNKCDPHQIDNEILKFYLREGNVTAYLKEAIAEVNDVFSQVSVFRNGTELIENTDYTVDNEASTITLIGPNSQSTNNVTATYTGTGSIIWAEDVNELQTAAQVLATNALDKNGDTMSGNLNMGGNNITNPGTVDGVDISTHNHSNGQGGLIGTAGLESGAVTSSVLADNSVITSKITDSSVTDAKIESVSVNKVIGLNNLYANRYLTNLENGLANVVCTENPTTSTTTTIQRPAVVIDTYRDSSGNWRRLYSDGWVEMGGIPSINSGSYVDIVLSPIVMLDTNYTIVAPGTTISNKTMNGFRMTNNSSSGICNWEIRGVASGTQSTVLFEQYNITNGSNVVNTLFTKTLTSNTNLEIVLAGACGYWLEGSFSKILGGGIIRCTKTFSTNQTIRVVEINNAQGRIIQGYSVGIGLGIYCDDVAILAVGGGGLFEYTSSKWYFIGGSGYNGGVGSQNGHTSYVTKNGYTITGTSGNFTGNNGVANGGSHTYSSFSIYANAYGGNGYIHSDYTSSTTATSGSETTGNFGNAYVKIIAY